MNKDKDYGLFKFIFMAIYALGVTAASFSYFFKVTFGEIPEANTSYANYILWFLTGTAITSFLVYYFGSSQSTSAHDMKDMTIPRLPADPPLEK